jgi:hypothetical protein
VIGLGLLIPLLAFAQVDAILSAKEIVIPRQNGACEPGAVVAIFSQDGEKEPLGFAEIQSPFNGQQCRAVVSTHSRSGLIRPGDRTELLDLEKGDNDSLEGRYDLLQEGKKEVAVRYKPLVYGGYIYGQTAATLDQGEFLAGLTPLMYGITDHLQADLVPLLLISQKLQGGIKYQFVHTEDNKLSLHAGGTKFLNIGKGSWTIELQYDSSSNSRSMTHTRLRYSSKQPDSLPFENRDKEKQGAAELSTVYEWVLPSWHRLLLGPKFTAGEEKDVGFLFTALFLYEHFHWSLNLEVNSLAKLNFRDYKQAVSADFFWRF